MTAVADVTDRSIGEIVSLAGRNAVVTGGARGLGKAIARRLAQAGANVLFCASDMSLFMTGSTLLVDAGEAF